MPRYYRYLCRLEEHGILRISSKNLAKYMLVNPSQIRQDLSCFGDFGQQGYGYSVPQLKNAIAEILGLSNNYRAILIGAGNVGKALLNHFPFENFGFQIIGVFDGSQEVIGMKIRDSVVLDSDTLEEFCRREKPDIAILCVSRQSVNALASYLYGAGVRNFWNCTGWELDLLCDDAIVENVHLNDSLMTLCYRITHPGPQSE